MSSFVMAAFVLTLAHPIVGGSARIFQWFAAPSPASGTDEQQSRTLGQPPDAPVAGLGRSVKYGRLADRTQPHRRARVLIHILKPWYPRAKGTMDARLQRRIQRYGWDLAAVDYESLWQAQLAEAQDTLLALASPAVGERVLDIACGTGLVSFGAARAVGPNGHVLGIDLSARMINAAERRARCRISSDWTPLISSEWAHPISG
jgi:methyltransferase family protein